MDHCGLRYIVVLSLSGLFVTSELMWSMNVITLVHRTTDRSFKCLVCCRLFVLRCARTTIRTHHSALPCADDCFAEQSAVSTPVMCSDVVVYPYQIYQARLAGADALKLIAPALPAKVGTAAGYGTLRSNTGLCCFTAFVVLRECYTN